MKILTWNVNGFRALVNKNAHASILELEPDVICLQEVKARPDQIADDDREFFGYQSIWNPAERPGYSGTATYTKIAPVEIKLGLGNDRFDIEGRVIRLQFPEFYLYNIYFPNGQRGLDRLDYKLSFYAYLLEQCDELHNLGKNIIICGDFNTAHQEIDLANPKENAINSGFLLEEREWIQNFLDHGFADIFRERYPEKIQYTWWTYLFKARSRNVGWRIDYFLISKSLLEKVIDITIHDEIIGSDHCPVIMEI